MFRLEDFFVVSLWPISSTTRLEKEELIYPFASLVAEFGGTLGLFLGFSFMTLWDGLESIGKMGRVLNNLFSCFKTDHGNIPSTHGNTHIAPTVHKNAQHAHGLAPNSAW